jgi:hypothetical protein
VPRRGSDRAVVLHGVTAVGVARPRRQHRHQVQVAHAQLAEVVEVLADPREAAGEAVGVADVAEHGGVLEPVGADGALEVQQPQLLGPLPVAGRQQPGHPLQQRVEVVVAAVGAGEAQGEVVPPAPQADQEQVDVATGQIGQFSARAAADPLRHPACHRPPVARPARLAGGSPGAWRSGGPARAHLPPPVRSNFSAPGSARCTSYDWAAGNHWPQTACIIRSRGRWNATRIPTASSGIVENAAAAARSSRPASRRTAVATSLRQTVTPAAVNVTRPTGISTCLPSGLTTGNS